MNAPGLTDGRAPVDASPVMAQYLAAKSAQPDALLFFRMGDFYELFFEDAQTAHAALGVALTRRGKHAGQDIPMAGVPAHAAESYMARLIRQGYRVAVCEQVEDPAEARKRGAKAVVRREVVRVVTAGTLTEDALLDGRQPNRLAAVAVRGARAAVAAVELSTGEVQCQAVDRDDLAAALAALAPAETLATDRHLGEPESLSTLRPVAGVLQPMAAALGEVAGAEARVKRLYGVDTLEGFASFEPAEISALGLIAAYLEATQSGRAPTLNPPRRLESRAMLAIDPSTRASLEIERGQAGQRAGSLLAEIDRTVTVAGARLLATRLSQPLLDLAPIEARLDAVEAFARDEALRRDVRDLLKEAGDVARALSRLTLGRGGPRDLVCLCDGLRVAEGLCERLSRFDQPLEPLRGEIVAAVERLTLSEPLARFRRDLSDALVRPAPAGVRDGGFIAPGWSEALDAARALRDDSRKVIAGLEAAAQADTGLGLRVRHNGVLGYYFEIAARMGEALLRPPLNQRYLHRQTLADKLRFTTAELAELDGRIARAAEQAQALEREAFDGFARAASSHASALSDLAHALCVIDVAAGVAQWSAEVSATRPLVDDSAAFEVEACRHPVVESAVRRAGEPFTPNDCRLDGEAEAAPRLAIVTGPNMAGKSTFLRQNALMVVLAQAGCFVPARRLRLGWVDRLFSRVGAGDDLARGRSTFMTEMVETAAILSQATERSFVVLDEIGRGTATYDGLAIAWACAEALHDVNRCRTLFATHYHELAQLESRLAGAANLSLRAREWNGQLVFLHEVGPGAADRSYGVHVAKLAGVPRKVVARARAILERLERDNAGAGLAELPLFAQAVSDQAEEAELSAVERLVAQTDPDQLTPREALDLLYRLKALAS